MKGAIVGSVRLRVRSPWPERVINLLAESDIAFRELNKPDGTTLELVLTPSGAERLADLAEKRGFFTVEPVEKYGFPFLLKSVTGRWALAAGLFLALAAVWFSGFFIWQFEVIGNETVPTAQILAALREEGIDVGSSVFSVDIVHLQDRVLLSIPKLSWVTVNVRGSRAYVLCREKRPIPERITEGPAERVTAKRSGLVTNVIVLRGVPTVQAGDTVEAGEVLCEAGKGEAWAEAVVTARTWYELSASMPLSCLKKSATGAVSERSELIFAGKRIKFYFTGRNPYAFCDKITENTDLILPGGEVLPVTLKKESFAEARLTEAELGEAEAETLLRARLLERLGAELGAGSVLSRSFEARTEGGVLTVTLFAECEESIGS